MENLLVLVPRKGTRADALIARGSAVVGRASVITGHYVVDFEGAIYGQKIGYADRLRIAAGRHVERYPTIARAILPEEELTVVGSYRYPAHELDLEDARTLSEWTDA